MVKNVGVHLGSRLINMNFGDWPFHEAYGRHSNVSELTSLTKAEGLLKSNEKYISSINEYIVGVSKENDKLEQLLYKARLELVLLQSKSDKDKHSLVKKMLKKNL